MLSSASGLSIVQRNGGMVGDGGAPNWKFGNRWFSPAAAGPCSLQIAPVTLLQRRQSLVMRTVQVSNCSEEASSQHIEAGQGPTNLLPAAASQHARTTTSPPVM